MIKLKNCPFCGEEADIVLAGIKYWVFCSCGVQMLGADSDDAKGERKTIEKWNRRISDGIQIGFID